MRIRLVAGATLALITISMVTGCTTGDGRSPDRTPAAESSESAPTPTPTPEPTTSTEPTPEADPSAARDLAIEACTVIATNNFVEPGVQDALREASKLAIAASEADAQWEPLAQSVTLLGLAYVLKETNADLLVRGKPPVVEQCGALGVAITG
jgi:hypothetical protein